MRWPARIEPGSLENDSFVAGIDILPTILKATGIPVPGNIDEEDVWTFRAHPAESDFSLFCHERPQN